MLRFDVIAPHELSPGQAAAWRDIQYAASGLESPFFAPEYALAVGAERGDARVGVVSDANRAVAFFPFHARRHSLAAPIGGPISDYQGAIVSPAATGLDAQALLGGCRLAAYDFNHAPASQTLLAPHAFLRVDSPALDLSGGYEDYRERRIASGTSEIGNAERKMRKMERELGPLRFIANDGDALAWDHTLRWKNDSYARLGVDSIIDVGWVRACLERLRAIRTPDFEGMLSTLYAGERLVAAHFGLRSRTDIHWWFPTYDPELDRYSPGLALLLSLARWGAENGVGRIDLGRGKARYKQAFANAGSTLCEGSIERATSIVGAPRRVRKLTHAMLSWTGSERAMDFHRRLFNDLLGAGRLGA
jgi:CelD/BcsL family acetyltransferase involved in cellulose biosynthesis